MVKLFEISKQGVRPTEHCYTIGYLKDIIDEYGEFYDDEYESVARLVAMHNSTDFNDDSLANTDQFRVETEKRYAELEALKPNPKRLGYDELVVDTTYRVMKTKEYYNLSLKEREKFKYNLENYITEEAVLDAFYERDNFIS